MSILKVQQLQHTNGTVGLDIDTNGTVHIPGHVVQVQQSTASANFNTSSTSYIQGPQTSTFTMKNSSNKVLVTMNFLARATKTSGNYNGARYAIYRGSIASGTKLTGGTEPQMLDYSADMWAWQTLTVLDTPGASSVTYSIGLNKHSEGATAQIMGSYGTTVMLLQEIAQ